MFDGCYTWQPVGVVIMFRLLYCVTLISVAVTTPTVQTKDDLKIVGGDDIEITEAPYQVSLVSYGRHACGGAIIAKDIIVTAAHCVSGSLPSSYQVRVGSSYSDKGGQLYPVGDMIVHPAFTYNKMDGDIAVMWLPRPLRFSKTVVPVKLAGEADEITDGDLTVVTGWGNVMEGGGSPSMLQRVFIPKVNEQQCNQAYSPVYSITPRMLCAGVPEGGKDACQGDSGGPMVHNDKLVGVVSWGLGCARPDFPGVYAKVSALRSWLDVNIKRIRARHTFSLFGMSNN